MLLDFSGARIRTTASSQPNSIGRNLQGFCEYPRNAGLALPAPLLYIVLSKWPFGVRGEFNGRLNTKWNCFYYETESFIYIKIYMYTRIYYKNRNDVVGLGV